MSPPRDPWEQPTNAVLVERMEAIRADLRRMEQQLNHIESEVSGNYVSKSEFLPVKLIAFGFVGVVLLAFMGLLMYTVGWKL